MKAAAWGADLTRESASFSLGASSDHAFFLQCKATRFPTAPQGPESRQTLSSGSSYTRCRLRVQGVWMRICSCSILQQILCDVE